MIREQAIAEMEESVANPPWCYDDSNQMFEYVPVSDVRRWLTALTPSGEEFERKLLAWLKSRPRGCSTSYVEIAAEARRLHEGGK